MSVGGAAASTEPLGEFRFLAERRLSLKGLTGLHPVAELDWRASRPRSEDIRDRRIT